MILSIDQGTTNYQGHRVDADRAGRRIRRRSGGSGVTASRVDRAGCRGDLGERAGRRGRLSRVSAAGCDPGRGDHLQPAGVGRGLAAEYRRPTRSGDRLAGPPHGIVVYGAGHQGRRRRGPGPYRPADRRHVLRAEVPLAARPAAGGPEIGRVPGHHRRLAGLAIDRRRRLCLRGGQRLADSAVRRARPELVAGAVRPLRCPGRDPPRGAAVERVVRADPRRTRTTGRRTRTRGSGRLARRALRTGLHHGRHGQGDVRHRLVGDDADRDLPG